MPRPIHTVVLATSGPHLIRPHAQRRVELSGNEVAGEPAAEIQSVEAETQALTRTRLSVDKTWTEMRRSAQSKQHRLDAESARERGLS